MPTPPAYQAPLQPGQSAFPVGTLPAFTGLASTALPATKAVSVVTPALATADLAAKKTATDNIPPSPVVPLGAAQASQTQANAQPQGQPQGQSQGQGQGQNPAQAAATNPNTQNKAELLNMLNTGNVKLTIDQARLLAGTNFTGLTQNPDGTWTPDSSAVSRIDSESGYTPNASSTNPQQYINDQRQSLDQQATQAYTDYTNQIAQIANGSFPLTQSQQAQVDALQAQFNQLYQQQLTANKNYEGAVTTLGIRSGRARYASEIESGNIQAAVSYGLSKLADINSQATNAVAALRQGFMDNDYKLINAQYTALQDLIKRKSDTLAEMQQSIKDELDAQTQRIQQQSALLQIEKTTVENIAASALGDVLKPDGSVDYEALQSIADNQGVDPNVLYGAILKEKDAETLQRQQEAKFATDQETARLNQEKLKTDINQAPLDAEYKRAQIDKLKADTDATRGANSTSSGDFAATIDLAANTAGSVYGQKAVKQALTSAIANKDYKSAYAQIVQATANGLGGTSGTNFEQQNSSLTVLDGLERAIQAYKDAGGNTNIFKGTADKIQTKIGALMTDPQYAALATQLDAAFQQYRLNMTGAAFGAQESAEYASVLPSKSNTLDLNLAKLQGAKAYLNSAIEGAIRSQVGDGGVYIKEYADRTVTAPDGQQVIIKD